MVNNQVSTIYHASFLHMKGQKLSVVCQKIYTSGQWPKDWTQSLIILLLKMATHDLIGTTEQSADSPPPKHIHATGDFREAGKPCRIDPARAKVRFKITE